MSLDTKKTDAELGLKVENYLLEKKVNTPTKNSFVKFGEDFAQTPMYSLDFTNEGKINLLQDYFFRIMSLLGLDVYDDDSLKDTPLRVAKMYVNEIFWGLDYKNFPKCTAVENKMNYDEMVIEKNVTVQSFCEHHLVQIDGFATVAYIPKNKVIGLSKIPRIIDYFCRRPQIQERLTEQIFYALEYILETDNIAVVIDASHFCVKTRGVQDMNSNTITTKLGGAFKNEPIVRAEFMSYVSKK